MKSHSLYEACKLAKNIGLISNSREFSTKLLRQHEDYLHDIKCAGAMTPPWVAATLISSLRGFSSRVGEDARDEIEAMIRDVEAGLVIASRYRYR